MKIISIIDDVKSADGLINEHGLSFYIETKTKKYLLDVGASSAFIHNATQLGIDIKNIDSVFISHNHYDHIGGLKKFLEVNTKAKIYIRENAKVKLYTNDGLIKRKISGCHDIFDRNPRFVFVKSTMIVDDIHVLIDTNANQEYFCQDKRLLKKENDKFILDNFEHEMFLAVPTKNSVSILSSCSHRGIINILETTKKHYNLPIDFVFAGLHMSANNGTAMNCSEEYFELVADYIKSTNMKKLYTCHCTGVFTYNKLKEKLNSQIEYFYMGNEVNI